MKLKIGISIILLNLLSACGLKPIASEYNLITTSTETVTLEKLGVGKVLIYNGANMLHKIDNTSNLNIWINDKPLGHLRSGQYVIIYLLPGKYTFKVLHKDVVKMESIHVIEIDEKTKIIKAKPNITSNKVEITNELPQNFQWFVNAKF